VQTQVNADWLSQLAPGHAPAPPGWWPPAPGWWALALMFVVGVAFAFWQWRRWRRPSARRLRRAAMRELSRMPSGACDDATFARRLQDLLRRYAVARYGRETVARLSGEAWVAFVVAHGGAAWTDGIGQRLLRCAYGGSAAADRERWLDGARAFVEAGA
jgi:predicted lysophospholipase L1 biosynthesis ABC-type transport system permease subunit